MRILLITHETSRTGAPRVAAVITRGLVESGHKVHVVARTRGPLLPDFESIAPTSLEFLFRVRRKIRAIRAVRFLAVLLDTLQALGAILRWRPDLVYVNSAAAAIYLRPATWLRRRTILHVHESGPVAQSFLESARLKSVPSGVDIVACSPSTESDLIALMPERADAVHMVASVPDDAMVVRLSAEPIEWDDRPADLVVGCCGAVENRKGVDLWVQAASLIRAAIPDHGVRFVWIGDGDPPVGAEDAAVEFIGPKSNPYPYMNRFDIFTLPSRDDPFPLVVIEAMLLDKPTVAFAVGGVPEQIGCAGIVVSPGDVNAFAQAVTSLLMNESERDAIGQAAGLRARERYSTIAFLRSIAGLVNER